jgi:acetyl-CoA carboxylase alpha subunit
MKNYKKTIARNLRTKQEVIDKVPIFQCNGWEKQKEAKANKLANRIKKVKDRKIERLAKIEAEGTPTPKKNTTPAERKQIAKRAKRIKFANKIKKIIGN